MVNQYLTAHRLLRRLQQKNRFIGRVSHSGLTVAETHFIIELQADPTKSIVEMTTLLRLNQSSCSRIAQSLGTLGLIKTSVSPLDSRRKVLTITEKGKKLIERIDQVSNGVIAGYRKRVSAEEFQFLIKCLRLIADGYGHPSGQRRENESEYRVEQRRVTRCFGLLGHHVFESNLSSSQWQALSEVVLAPMTPRTTEVADLLGLAQNSFSSVVDFLERHKYLKRRKHPRDKRMILLIPSPEGERVCREIEQKAAHDLERSLGSLSTQKLARFVDVLSRFVGESNPTLPPLLPGYRIEELVTDEQRSIGRAFSIRCLVEQGLELSCPEEIVSSKSRVFLASFEERPECLLEYRKDIVFAAWTALVSPWIISGLMNQVAFIVGGQATVRFRHLKMFLVPSG